MPGWVWMLALVVIGGVQQLRVSCALADAAGARGELADYRLEISERDRRADARARTEEQRRQKVVDEVEKNVREKLEVVQADAVAAESSAAGLRREVERLRASRAATCGAITAQQRAARQPAIVVLGELLESADRMAGDLAAALDRSRVAGMACEAAYESLDSRK